MRASIAVFYIAALATSAVLQAQAQPQDDPDALYRERAALSKAREAVSIWSARLAKDPKDFESAWKLARAEYWLGGHDDKAARRGDLERGVEAGRQASLLEPKRPEGHFWMAACMGALAESFGMRQGLKYRTPIREALEKVLQIDPAYQNGSADRALGRWYYKVPGLFGGSKKKSEVHLRKSLSYDQQSTASRFFLAETLFELDRKAEAIAELQRVIDGPVNPEWEPEDREFKELAAARLKKERR
jgi:cytochrome c-type biogenesis protein CcmH/NrfG